MTLAEEWAGYSKAVIPEEAPAVQKRECKRAFYGGALALYALVMNGLDSGDEVTIADLELMKDLHNELSAFNGRVIRGEE